ncbi:uncharacterized protein TNCV_2589761 [Trichonephila clavipes]|nr:uncharacterized protein TNCV_2589761 [Trichonephila clavipes]
MLSSDVKPHSLKLFSYFKFDSDRIHFQIELLNRVRKKSNVPEFARQMALETIHGIPHSALKIYIDGSMSNSDISGSGVHIETLNGTFDIKLRSFNWCSVFRWDLTAIYKGLQFIDISSKRLLGHLDTNGQLCFYTAPFSLATVGDITHLDILDLVVQLSSILSMSPLPFWIPKSAPLLTPFIVTLV